MKRSNLFIVGVVLLVVILAGGAFTAARLFSAQNADSDEYGPGVQVFEDVFDDGSGPVTILTIVEPAPELPESETAASGILTRVEDNSLFIGTGSVSVNVSVVNGERTVSTDHSGPEIEVVLGRDTIFYLDETDINLEATENVERHVQQEVRQVDKPATFAEGVNIAVWGNRSGDRVTADVVVFEEGVE